MSVEAPLVSVVIPYGDVPNRPQFLDLVLSGYEKQTYGRIEILVVYDGLCIVKDLESVTRGRKVKLLGFSPGQGYARRGLACNIGAANAQGQILIFNDVDVIPDNTSVERAVKVHSKNPGLVFCGRIWRIRGGLSAAKSIDASKREQLRRVSIPWEYDPSLEWSNIGSVQSSDLWWPFITGFCFFPRSIFLYLTGFDPGYFEWGYEDTDLGYRILNHRFPIAYFDDIEAFHIDHPREESINSAALRNLDRFTHKFPELKSFPVLVKRRKELKEQIARTNSLSEGALKPLRSRLRDFFGRFGLDSRIHDTECSASNGSIAVVIPAKNRAKFLRGAVLSAVRQSRPPREVYIVVDPSEDGTEAVADDLALEFSGVRCIRNKETRGVAESRNQGVAASASDYIMFLDSDDLLKPSYFEKVASVLDRARNVGIAYSDYEEFGGRSRKISLPAFNPKLLLVDCIIMGPAMVRRRTLEKTGGYDREQVFEDWELWIRVVRNGWLAKGVHELLYNYRIHAESRDTESNKLRKVGEDMIYRKHLELYRRFRITRTDDGRWVGAPAFAPYR